MSPAEELLHLLNANDLAGFLRLTREMIRAAGSPTMQVALGRLRRRHTELRDERARGLLADNDFAVGEEQLRRAGAEFVTEFIEPNAHLFQRSDLQPRVDGAALKDRLRNVLHGNGPDAFAATVILLAENPDLVDRVTELRHRLRTLALDRNEGIRHVEYDTHEDDVLRQSAAALRAVERTYRTAVHALHQDALRMIDGLDPDLDLAPDWKYRAVRPERYLDPPGAVPEGQLLLSPLDMIQVPTYLRQTEPDVYLRYKRRMVQAQDAYLARDYATAYDGFLGVRNDLDPESAQLYDYLLLSYYRAHGGPDLIDALFDYRAFATAQPTMRRGRGANLKTQIGEGRIVSVAPAPTEEDRAEPTVLRPLQPLYLYADRYRHLQSGARDPLVGKPGEILPGTDQLARPVRIPHSASGKANARTVARELFARLLHRYAELADREPAEGREAITREAIRQCIRTATELYRHLQPDELVFRAITGELLGAGRGFYLTIDEWGNVANVEVDFDALDHFRELLSVFTAERVEVARRRARDWGETVGEVDAETIARRVREGVALSVHDRLVAKYRGLETVANANDQHAVRPLIELLTSFRVAEELLPGTGLFHALPIGELSGRNGKADWFELGRHRRLTSRFTAENGTFPALEFFEYFLRVRDASEGTLRGGEALEIIIQNLYVKMGARTREQYVIAKDKPGYELRVVSAIYAEQVRGIIRNWQILYDVEQDFRFLELQYEEFTGNGAIFWWAIGSQGLHSNPKFLPHGPHVDVRHELNRVIDEYGYGNKYSAYQTVIQNYFDRVVLPRTEAVAGTGGARRAIPGDDTYAELYELIENLLQLARHYEVSPGIVNYLHDELVGELTLPWFDLTELGIVPHPTAREHGVDAYPLLGLAMDVFAEDARFTAPAVRDQIALNRLDQLEAYYYENFTRDQDQTYYNDDSVVELCLLVERLIDYHRLTENPRLLAIPYEELVSGLGKITWARKGIFFDFSLVGDTDDQGRVTRWKFPRFRFVAGRVWPRWKVKRVAHFAFRENYLYVRKYYRFTEPLREYVEMDEVLV